LLCHLSSPPALHPQQAKASQEGRGNAAAAPSAAYAAKYEERINELQTQLSEAQATLNSSQAAEAQLRSEQRQLLQEIADVQEQLGREAEQRGELQDKAQALSQQLAEARQELDVVKVVSGGVAGVGVDKDMLYV
jgi:DNA repair exonuclease SbcCD ATPase subunit